MSRPLAWLLGLLGLVVLTLLCAWVHAPGIERDLQERTTLALDERGFIGTGVALSGRDVTLKGGVPSEDARIQALAAVRAVPGVRVVHDELRVVGDEGAAANGLFSMSEGAGGAFIVRGAMPDEDSRQSLLERIGAAFPGRTIQDELTVGGGTSGWRPSVEALLPRLGEVDAPSLSVDPVPAATAGMDGATVVLRGRVPSEAVRAEVEAAAAAAVQAPYRFRSELVVDGAADEDDGTTASNTDQLEASGSDDADVQAAEAALQDALSGGAVQFELATADLTASSRQILDRVAQVLERYPSVRAEVQGHTDSEDSSEHNLRLSQQRAEAVLAYLTRQGIDADRLTARGYGEDQPIATNDTAEGRARNRRVVFRLDG